MILLVILALTGVLLVALVYGSVRWKSETARMHARLEAARRPIGSRKFNFDELNGLPEVVQRYLRKVLKDGQPMVSAVLITHSGTINMSATGESWKPFTSTQRIIAQRPGFDWEARIGLAPGLAVHVHDAYIAGEGILHASLFGLVSLANSHGTPDLAQGELIRWFAETAWYPTALLPGQGVQWIEVDHLSARATLKDGDTTATLLFRFDEGGLVQSMRAEARGRGVAGAVIPTPWEGKWSHYEPRNGMLIPLYGEVAWVLPEGPKPYWRGTIDSISYEFE